MTVKNEGQLLVISGIGFGRAPALYAALEKQRGVLNGMYPGFAFEFIGTPFGKRRHPLLWSKYERGRHPVERHLSGFSAMAGTVVRKIARRLERERILVALRFGFDLVTYATWGARDKNEFAAVHRIHHALVREFIKAKLKVLPHYFIVGEARSRPLPRSLCGVDSVLLNAFIQHEETTLDAYFTDTGQNEPIRLQSETTADLAMEVMRKMGGVLCPAEAIAA